MANLNGEQSTEQAAGTGAEDMAERLSLDELQRSLMDRYIEIWGLGG